MYRLTDGQPVGHYSGVGYNTAAHLKFTLDENYEGVLTMKFAIILAGCGQHDGSETHETVSTLLSLAQEKIEWEAFAPDILQHHVTNHLTNTTETGESRHVLKESARLARGKVRAITQANAADYDSII